MTRYDEGGIHRSPIDLDELGFPTEEIPFLENNAQFGDFFNLMIECANALRLCGSVTVPTPQGQQDPSGMYPKPLSRTQVNYPDSPLPYFGNHTQHARIRNWFVDAFNALRRCYVSATPTAQGTSIDGGVYRPPKTIAVLGFPDNPLPTKYFGNDTQGAGLYNYLIDVLNRLANCCTCNRDDSGTAHVSALSSLRLRGDDFGAWSLGQYAAFLTNTETNANYENGIPDTPVNSPSPAEFDDYNFNWDTDDPATPRNRISQVNWNGGHRSVKSIKTTADLLDDHSFFEIVANGKIGGAKMDACWTRQVLRYSENYMWYDASLGAGRGIILVQFSETKENLDVSRFITGTVANEGFNANAALDQLRCSQSWSGGGGGSIGTNVGTMQSKVINGQVLELICFCGQPLTAGVADPTKLRLAVWLGPAGAINPVTHKLYDQTLTGLPNARQIGKIWMFRKTDTHRLLTGNAMCYECLEWEVINALTSGAHNNPYGLD